MVEYTDRALEALLRDSLQADAANVPLRLRPADVYRRAQARRRGTSRGRVLALAAALALLVPISLLIGAGSEAPAPAMTVPRASATATVLGDGRVLLTGGWNDTERDLASAEVYDPATGRSTVTGSMSEGRWDHAAVLLEDGSVLVVGGSGLDRYDPTTGSFRRIDVDLRWPDGAAATRLADGRVLILGAERGSLGARHLSVFDPATEALTWFPIPDGLAPSADATLVPLDDGRVLVAGERGSYRSGRYPAVVMLDPATGTTEPLGSYLAGSFLLGSTEYEAAGVRMHDGRVLLALPYHGLDSWVFLLIWDPATDAVDWAAQIPVSPGTVPVRDPVALADGRVLVPLTEASDAELPGPLDIYAFDPRTNETALVASAVGASDAPLTALQEGGALLAGGSDADGSARIEMVRIE